MYMRGLKLDYCAIPAGQKKVGNNRSINSQKNNKLCRRLLFLCASFTTAQLTFLFLLLGVELPLGLGRPTGCWSTRTAPPPWACMTDSTGVMWNNKKVAQLFLRINSIISLPLCIVRAQLRLLLFTSFYQESCTHNPLVPLPQFPFMASLFQCMSHLSSFFLLIELTCETGPKCPPPWLQLHGVLVATTGHQLHQLQLLPQALWAPFIQVNYPYVWAQ